MGVRVKVRLEAVDGREVVRTVALVNSGYETKHPEICLPERLARKLKLYPAPDEIKMILIRTSGGIAREIFVPRAVKVYLLSERDEELGSVIADVSISEIENEVLLSDSLTSALKIVIEDPFRGLWRIRGENRILKSAEPEYW